MEFASMYADALRRQRAATAIVATYRRLALAHKIYNQRKRWDCANQQNDPKHIVDGRPRDINVHAKQTSYHRRNGE